MSARVSPGGAILRSSRVFSLPAPLPIPTSALFGSDTATLPHPVQQSITTPYGALRKGDWGFKRSLPLKTTTKTSTPFLRINAIDTPEQITDFVSSADHAVTLRKWQEMDMPLTIPMPKPPNVPPGFKSEARMSVFEEGVDKIANIEDKLGSEDKRWKFEGPWLAGLNEGDFQEYVRRKVKGRKREFREYLRKPLADRMTSASKRAALAAADYGKEVKPQIYEATDVTENQLDDYIKSLRGDRMSLNQHIRAFLDLPPAPTRKERNDDSFDFLRAWSTKSPGEGEVSDSGFAVSESPYANSGPPKTHPSAGLSYLRSSNFVVNHPLHGPRDSKAPVEARIVMPKGAGGRSSQPLIGVGGIVCDIPTGTDAGASAWNFKAHNTRYYERRPASQVITGLLNIEPEKVGGSKAYVQPTHASIDPNGRVIMKVDAADPVAVAVKQGKIAQMRQLHQQQSQPAGMGSLTHGTTRSIFPRTPQDKIVMALRKKPHAKGYGLGSSTSKAPFRPDFENPGAEAGEPVGGRDQGKEPESDAASRSALDSIMNLKR